MNVTDIKYFSTVNGDGIRTAVFVSGCNLHCPGCFNNGAWSFNVGHQYDRALLEKTLDSVDRSYISGLSILGGEPLDEKNQSGVAELIYEFRQRFGNSKDIWVWTGYVYGENIPKDDTDAYEYIISNVDVLVDGPFISAERDTDLAFRGSRNQRVIDMKATLSNKKKKVVCKEYDERRY